MERDFRLRKVPHPAQFPAPTPIQWNSGGAAHIFLSGHGRRSLLVRACYAHGVEAKFMPSYNFERIQRRQKYSRRGHRDSFDATAVDVAQVHVPQAAVPFIPGASYSLVRSISDHSRKPG